MLEISDYLQEPYIQQGISMATLHNFTGHTAHGQGSHLDDLDPFRYTLKLTKRSDQNFMDPLNFTRHGMSNSFAELLTPKIVM